MQADQMNIPEDMRKMNVPRNPHCRKELFKSQDAIEEEIEMQNEDWYPQDSKFNIYQQKNFKNSSKYIVKSDSNLKI